MKKKGAKMLSLQECHERCLYPCVRIRTPKALGSGTVIFTEPTSGEKGMTDTYVLTNEHVVDNLISVQEKWSTLLQRQAKADVLGHPDVEVFNYAYQTRVHGASSLQADIMAYDKEEDIALLRVRSGAQFKYVAQMYPEADVNKLVAFMPVWNVGCGLGGPPAITPGYLSAFGVDIDHRDYFLVTAPSIFGNSGGATFLQESGHYIGIPARISVASLGWSADVITHLGFSITVARIYQFLRDQIFDFIIDTSKSSEQCEKERKEKRERDMFLRKQGEE